MCGVTVRALSCYTAGNQGSNPGPTCDSRHLNLDGSDCKGGSSQTLRGLVYIYISIGETKAAGRAWCRLHHPTPTFLRVPPPVE